MSYFKAKIHQIRFWLGQLTALRQTPSWISADLIPREGRGGRTGGKGRKEGEGRGGTYF